MSAVPAVAVAIVLVVGAALPVVLVHDGVVACVAVAIAGLIVVQPNRSRVHIVFGRYAGTVTASGWCARRSRCACATSRPAGSRSTTPSAARSRPCPSSARDIAELHRRAALAPDLMVVLSGDRGPAPVLSVGS